jgi:hypothetical protein
MRMRVRPNRRQPSQRLGLGAPLPSCEDNGIPKRELGNEDAYCRACDLDAAPIEVRRIVGRLCQTPRLFVRSCVAKL